MCTASLRKSAEPAYWPWRAPALGQGCTRAARPTRGPSHSCAPEKSGFLFSGNGFRVPTINAGTLVNPLVNRRCCRPVARADGREGPRCSPAVALEAGRAEEAWRAAQEVSRTCRSAFGAKRALSSLGFAGFLARHGVLPHANCLARASSAAHAHACNPAFPLG